MACNESTTGTEIALGTPPGTLSASDFDDDTRALLAADDTSRDEPPEEQIGPEDAEHYESLIVQHVLSAHMEKAERISGIHCFQQSLLLKSIIVI
jgi:hypothetical protein